VTDRDLKSSEAELTARLEALKKSLAEDRADSAHVATNEMRAGDKTTSGGIATGTRVVGDLVGGVLVGGGIGYFLDGYFATSPWLLLLFLVLGTAAGFRNVYQLGMRPTSVGKPVATAGKPGHLK
jgi:ATP synthase protein I